MKKFSAGGAQGRYDRRMADIEKDYAKAMTRKTGKAAEVADAKRQQRIADAKDDLAKRTGADRTATRAAERTAESNLTKTRKYGAPKSVSTEAPAAKVTDSLGAITVPKSGISTDTKKAPVKTAKAPVRTPKAGAPKADTPKVDYKKVSFGKPATAETAPQAAARVKEARTPTTTGGTMLRGKPMEGGLFSGILTTAEKYKKEQEAKGYGKAKGGKIMKKFAKGGSIPPQPSAADRARSKKHLDELKKLKPTDAEGKVAGSANRSEGRRYAAGGVTKEMPSSKAMGSMNMAKGGKAKAKPAAKGKGNPFAATKFGAAMMKKSADTKGRAMPKFAKGGSIDGCAVKGKTKTSMLARGGAAKMRSRDSYGGAMFKKGGKTC
jgi:hypothetical protein